jgi:hypothetical protein
VAFGCMPDGWRRNRNCTKPGGHRVATKARAFSSHARREGSWHGRRSGCLDHGGIERRMRRLVHANRYSISRAWEEGVGGGCANKERFRISLPSQTDARSQPGKTTERFTFSPYHRRGRRCCSGNSISERRVRHLALADNLRIADRADGFGRRSQKKANGNQNLDCVQRLGDSHASYFSVAARINTTR